ncbi:hypothetical protein FOZ60_002426 [Perkinsus olseni]|uniref:Uncharacterized protein n=1 Tax=Perkinsus olseni TaxID=32597 RepID=A0A7J6NZ10_PEROL|nr:hypothetical protein FOZ60_002426 [Perkinsus olseni]
MEAAAEHALREAVMLGYSREALCYLGCTLICRGRYEEASGILDRVFMRLSTIALNLVKAVNLHGKGDVDGCCRYLGLATRDKTFFRGLKTEQQIFDKLRLYDGAEHHQGPHGGSGEDGEQGLVTGDVAGAEDSPRSAHTEERMDSPKARLGLYHNLLPPVPTAELYLAPPDHTTLTLLKELVVDHSLYDFANLVGLAVRQVRKEIGSTSFLSQVFRQWCEFHHLVAVSLAHQGHWDEAMGVLERIEPPHGLYWESASVVPEPATTESPKFSRRQHLRVCKERALRVESTSSIEVVRPFIDRVVPVSTVTGYPTLC